MKAVRVIIVISLAILVFGLLYIFLGFYDVSASREEGGMQGLFFSGVMESSVKRHAGGVNVPALGDSVQLAEGFDHYDEMCVTCHGAPGISKSEIGKGLNPAAPELPKETPEWSNAELYWIIKNGIKMTGMPAFGTTHSEEELWAMTAFVRHLEKMSKDDYWNLIKSRPSESMEGMSMPEHHDDH